MKKRLMMLAVLTVTVLLANAQVPETSSGIHFEQQLKWSEILAKAKAEHKYIFVDCYATWCAPCKWMEANVYTDKQVAGLYNKTFISLKIQMDKTNKDDSLTRSRYDRVKTFKDDYHVNAYPTFLFFDPAGKPVHKVAGALDAKQFIQLASDAQNPSKQYYAILKNFQPNKLDTAEEKGIAFSFAGSDKELGGRIAADYLSRIPAKQLNQFSNAQLMVTFQNNPEVCDFAVKLLKSMASKDFLGRDNIFFIKALYMQKNIRNVVIAYINQLNGEEMTRDDNTYFVLHFLDDKDVKQIAQNYIDGLPETALYNKSILELLNGLTNVTNDKGFAFFYDHSIKIDSIFKSKNYAENLIHDCIYNAECQSLLNTAKASKMQPDFENMEKIILQKYNGINARELVLEAKVNWYDYIVNQQKQEAYGEQLVEAEVEKEKIQLSKTNDPDLFGVNNISMQIYLHSSDTTMLNQAINWMKAITRTEKPLGLDYYATLDTYASVLYKRGSTSQAITVEEQAASAAIDAKDKDLAGLYHAKTSAMKQGEKIWLIPSYQ